MRKILIVVSFFSILKLNAQTVSDIGKIALSVVVSSDVPQAKVVENKLTQLVSRSGMASHGMENFQIYPKINIQSVDVAEGGMQKIFVANVDVNFYIGQSSNGLVFSSYVATLKGSGNSKERAIANVFQKIDVNSPKIKDFIEQGKAKILEYYQNKCSDIINQIDNLYKTKNDYEEALALAMSIPTEVSSCYEKAQNKAISIYQDYQIQICSKNIQYAKTMIAQQNYSKALDILAGIDPTASCFLESKKLISSIENKISAEERKKWDFIVKKHNDAVSLEKQRIDASLEKQKIDANLEKQRMDVRVEKQRIDASLEKQRIDAIKDIVVSYYKSKRK